VKPLRRLLATLGDVTMWSEGDRLPARYFECPLMSLPYTFGTTLATIPAAPYLRADPLFSNTQGGKRIGLCWADKPQATMIDKRRSIALADLTPILSAVGCTFVSLQLGPPASQLRTLPAGVMVYDLSPQINDWLDTARLIASLDLVITVDTAVAHLAGALGKPVWMLNRFDTDWRWLLDRADTPWYPTMRIYRQPMAGDWKTPITQMAAAIRSGR
jgi:glycosyl transferase family 9 (putative heptosyltransferase)